jgi:hypothetical protein
MFPKNTNLAGQNHECKRLQGLDAHHTNTMRRLAECVYPADFALRFGVNHGFKKYPG